MKDSHTLRVQEELKAAGMTKYGLLKLTTRCLPRVIHENEHIRAAVYGRYKQDGWPLSSEGMLVATDKRIIFVNWKPGYTSIDELSYDIIAGLNVSRAIFFSALSLYTRMSTYTIRFANSGCVARFADYVERRRLTLEETPLSTPLQAPDTPALPPHSSTKQNP